MGTEQLALFGEPKPTGDSSDCPVNLEDLTRGTDNRVAAAVEHIFGCFDQGEPPEVNVEKALSRINDIAVRGIDKPSNTELYRNRKDSLEECRKWTEDNSNEKDALVVFLLDQLDNSEELGDIGKIEEEIEHFLSLLV